MTTKSKKVTSKKVASKASVKTKKVAAKAPAKTKTVKAAEPPKEKKEKKAKQVITIVKALYGTMEKSIDVASKMVPGRKITNKLAGEDPCPKQKKTLSVTATIDGKEVTKVFNEGEKLVF